MIEALRALEKAVELIAKATPGPWLYRAKSNTFHQPPPEGTAYSYGNSIMDADEDFPTLKDEDIDAILGAVNFIREHGAAILSARQEVAPVGYTEEVFALARRCLFIAFAWNDHNHDPAHKLARETAERCGIKSFDQANDWLESEPATGQTSEARDAVDVADVRIVIDFIFRHFGQHWNVGPALTDDVVAAVRRVEAAMRQEAE